MPAGIGYADSSTKTKNGNNKKKKTTKVSGVKSSLEALGRLLFKSGQASQKHKLIKDSGKRTQEALDKILKTKKRQT